MLTLEKHKKLKIVECEEEKPSYKLYYFTACIFALLFIFQTFIMKVPKTIDQLLISIELEDINELQQRYETLPEGEEKELIRAYLCAKSQKVKDALTYTTDMNMLNKYCGKDKRGSEPLLQRRTDIAMIYIIKNMKEYFDVIMYISNQLWISIVKREGSTIYFSTNTVIELISWYLKDYIEGKYTHPSQMYKNPH